MSKLGRPVVAVAPARPFSIKVGVEDFLLEGRARGHRPSTQAAYGLALSKVLLPFCERRGLEYLEDLDQRQFNRLNVELQERLSKNSGEPLSPATIHGYLRPIRLFMDWAREETGNQSLGRPRLPQLRRSVVKILTTDELRAMENAARTIRDKLIVRVLGEYGLRVGELCELRVDDLLFEQREWYLLVRGKGGRDRKVPVPYVGPQLKKLAQQRPSLCSNHLFLTLAMNRRGTYSGVSRSGVEKAMRALAQAAGIQKRVYCHLLRHTAITHFFRKKEGNYFLARQIFGNFNHLDIYVHLEAEDAARILREVLKTD